MLHLQKPHEILGCAEGDVQESQWEHALAQGCQGILQVSSEGLHKAPHEHA